MVVNCVVEFCLLNNKLFEDNFNQLPTKNKPAPISQLTNSKL